MPTALEALEYANESIANAKNRNSDYFRLENGEKDVVAFPDIDLIVVHSSVKNADDKWEEFDPRKHDKKDALHSFSLNVYSSKHNKNMIWTMYPEQYKEVYALHEKHNINKIMVEVAYNETKRGTFTVKKFDIKFDNFRTADQDAMIKMSNIFSEKELKEKTARKSSKEDSKKTDMNSRQTSMRTEEKPTPQAPSGEPISDKDFDYLAEKYKSLSGRNQEEFRFKMGVQKVGDLKASQVRDADRVLDALLSKSTNGDAVSAMTNGRLVLKDIATMTEKQIPSRDSYIDAVFGERGYLAESFPGYQARSGQIDLARCVDRAITTGRHLLSEAPCGTGKSIAYSIPASYHAATTGKKILIVTANIALQEQIIQKDLPMIHSIVPWEFSFALAKGRNNFLCLDKYDEVKAERHAFNRQGKFEAEGFYEYRDEIEKIIHWAELSIKYPDQHTGDATEAGIDPSKSRTWNKFSVSSDECRKKKCPYYDSCFAQKAKKKYDAASIVVTNYHLLFAHFLILQKTGMNVVLPRFDVLIMDESHKCANIARDAFGFSISEGSVNYIAKQIKKSDEAEHLKQCAAAYFEKLKAYAKDKNNSAGRISKSCAPEEGERVIRAIDTVVKKLNQTYENTFDEKYKHDLEVSIERGVKIASQLMEVLGLEDENVAYYLEKKWAAGSVSAVTINSKLVYAGPTLRKHIFKRSDNGNDTSQEEFEWQPTVAATSATLTVNGEFDYAARELGVDNYDTCTAESPFSWFDQSLFVVPKEKLVPPNDSAFPETVASLSAEIVDIAGGRTLGLFTSHKMLNTVADKLRDERKWNVLVQGNGSKTALIREFKEDIRSVLLGTESFWEGVDVPGESLSCLLIDRLPFPSPEDPVADLISKRDENWFFNYSVPKAIIQFNQGIGRLIRSVHDYGVIVCFDERIITKRYGKKFLISMPDMQKSTDFDHIGEFLEEIKWKHKQKT